MAVSSRCCVRLHTHLCQLLLLLLPLSHNVAATGELKIMLDDMSRFAGNALGYPRDKYQDLADCLSKWGEPVVQAHDESWRFFFNITTLVDPIPTEPTKGQTWLEGRLNRSAIFGGHVESLGEYQIKQQCNYMSNVAYRECHNSLGASLHEDHHRPIRQKRTYVVPGAYS